MTKKWILKIAAISCVMLSCFKVSAELILYQVKYKNEWGNTQTASYQVYEKYAKDISIWDIDKIRSSFNREWIIDEDSDAEDLAIVNKLDKQGYIIADGRSGLYIKINGKWHIFCGLKNK